VLKRSSSVIADWMRSSRSRGWQRGDVCMSDVDAWRPGYTSKLLSTHLGDLLSPGHDRLRRS
jgi:hypothetical protein